MLSPLFYIKKGLLSRKYNTPELKKLPEYRLSFLNLEKEYSIITDYEYDIESTKILTKDKSEEEQQIALLDVERKHNKIDNLEYTKRFNDAKNKPWVAIHTDYDADSDEDNMQIEVVYNQTFIKKMRKKGFPGDTDEEIAEQWLKLFLLANLDEDDLSLLGETDDLPDDEKYIKRTKVEDKTIIS